MKSRGRLSISYYMDDAKPTFFSRDGMRAGDEVRGLLASMIQYLTNIQENPF